MILIQVLSIAGGYMNALAKAQKKENKTAKYTFLSLTSGVMALKAFGTKADAFTTYEIAKNFKYSLLVGPFVAGAFFCMGSQLHNMIADT